MSGERRTLLNFVGVNTEVRDEVHAYANHYIEQSRPYFPNAQLPKYIHCPYFLRIAQWVCFASLIGTLVVKISGSASSAIPIGFFGACLLFFFIYCYGISKISHLLDENGTLPGYDDLRTNFQELKWLEFYGVLSAVKSFVRKLHSTRMRGKDIVKGRSIVLTEEENSPTHSDPRKVA